MNSRTYPDRIFSDSYLGIKDSEVKLDFMDLKLSRLDFEDEQARINYKCIDLVGFRPHSPWVNSEQTVVLMLDETIENLMEFSRVLQVIQPEGCHYLVTKEGHVIVRLWWD